MRFIFRNPRRQETRPGIFLDRDGIINRRVAGGYVSSWRQFEFISGIKTVLLTLSRIGHPLIVVSNQAGVGKGLTSRFNLEEITRRFVSALQGNRVQIDAVYYCTHTPRQRCSCRKPRPGLLERAARDLFVSLDQSVMVGDSLTDVEAARAAGCSAVWVASTQTVAIPPHLAIWGRLKVVRDVSGIPTAVNTLLRVSR